MALDGPTAVVRLTGRLDGESARHLSDTIEDLLRDGARFIEVEMAGVEYVSSAGMRELARRAEDLATLRGSLQVVSPSAAARSALEAAGLATSLIHEGPPTRISASTSRFTHWGLPSLAAQHGVYEVSHYSDAGVHCRVYGAGQSPLNAAVNPADCRSVPFPMESFGFGIGAIGEDFEGTAPRFGELVAAEGIVTYLPTDGAHTPDFLVSYSDRPPKAVLASGVSWQGMFSDLLRFSLQPNSDDIPLAELAEVCVEMCGGQAAALAAVAEMSGVVGTSLRRSPARLPPGFGEDTGAAKLRDWISFTPEPAHQGSTALIVGVATRRAEGPLAGQLRPLNSKGDLFGHLHAVVFPYSPVPQRTVMLAALVGRMFQTFAPKNVLHLLHDDRGPGGAGQTGLLRGVCWTARIDSAEAAP